MGNFLFFRALGDFTFESVASNAKLEECNKVSYFHSVWCVFALQNARCMSYKQSK